MTREEAIKQFVDAKIGCKKFISNEALEMAIKALEQEPCDDAISRQAVCRLLVSSIGKSNTYIHTKVLKLPPVQPKANKGQWMDKGYLSHHYYNDGEIETTELQCSCCRETVEWNIELPHKPYFCENCGADMREEQK